jgi:AcrR family transcriptional regulator
MHVRAKDGGCVIQSPRQGVRLSYSGKASKIKSTKKRGPNVAGEKARDHLLAVAISLFGECGYDGVSTRELTKHAGLNQASVYYYFRTKREIYVASVIKCFNAVAADRIEMIESLELLEKVNLEDVLRAFIAPHVRYVTKREGYDYLRIFRTFSTAPEDILVELYKEHFGPHRQRFIDLAHKLEPNIPLEELHRSFGIVANMIVSTLFDHGYQETRGKNPYKVNAEQFINMLVAYNAAGMRQLRASERRKSKDLAPRALCGADR